MRHDVGVKETVEFQALKDTQLVERARAGDEWALEALIARYRRFARGKARSYFLAGSDKEDVVQEGMIGLFKAIRDFDLALDTPFRAFAELCISRQILTAIKSANRNKHRPLNSSISLETEVYGQYSTHSIADTLSASTFDPAELVISAEEIEGIRRYLTSGLTELEADVLRLYMDGKSYEEIGNVLGNHVKAIDNALQRIKRKLYRYLAEHGAVA